MSGRRLSSRVPPRSSVSSSSSVVSTSLKNFSVCFECVSATLGKFIPVVGGQVKGSVLSSLCSNCVHLPHRSGRPTFNRMSGIQEFSNGVALFLNVFGDSYINSWREQKVGDSVMLTFRWFAQPSQTMESPSIHKILALATAAAVKAEVSTAQGNQNPASIGRGKKRKVKEEESADDSSLSPSLGGSLILYCRLLNEPYVFCGSLRYLSHNPDSRPIQFEFALNESVDERIRSSAPFQLLMDAAVANGRVQFESETEQGTAAVKKEEIADQSQSDQIRVKSEDSASDRRAKRVRVKKE